MRRPWSTEWKPHDKYGGIICQTYGVKWIQVEAWSLESEAKNILTRLGIWFWSKVDNSSGGQKRVALAAALIAPVSYWILDEPTNHIDPRHGGMVGEASGEIFEGPPYGKPMTDIFRPLQQNVGIEKRTDLFPSGELQINFLEPKAEREELKAGEKESAKTFMYLS